MTARFFETFLPSNYPEIPEKNNKYLILSFLSAKIALPEIESTIIFIILQTFLYKQLAALLLKTG